MNYSPVLCARSTPSTTKKVDISITLTLTVYVMANCLLKKQFGFLSRLLVENMYIMYGNIGHNYGKHVPFYFGGFFTTFLHFIFFYTMSLIYVFEADVF